MAQSNKVSPSKCRHIGHNQKGNDSPINGLVVENASWASKVEQTSVPIHTKLQWDSENRPLAGPVVEEV